MRLVNKAILGLSIFLMSSLCLAESTQLQKVGRETLRIGDVVKAYNVKPEIETSYGSGTLLGQNFSVFTLKPMLHANVGETQNLFYVNLQWTESSSTEGKDSFRFFSRPTLETIWNQKEIRGHKVSFVTEVKLPIYSSSDPLPTALNKSWEFAPGIQVERPLSGKTKLKTSANIAFNTASKGNFVNAELEYKRALITNIAADLNYQYDQNLQVGAIANISSALGKHKVQANSSFGSGTIDQASRDRVNLGVYGKYALNNESSISTKFSTALKNEDTLAGVGDALDNLDQTAKLTATVNYTTHF